MITSMMGRMADAEKLSIPQLQQAIKSGSIPAYVGIPMLQDKIKQTQQAREPQPTPPQPPVAQQVMEEASGIDRMPSNLPVASYNDGGIVAFAEGGMDDDYDLEDYEDQVAEAEYAGAIQDMENTQEEVMQHQLNMQRANSELRSAAKEIYNTPSVEGGVDGLGEHKEYDQHRFVRGVGGGHKGIDYAMPVGTPISPKVEGILRYNTRDKHGWGNAAEIVSDDGRVLQRFAHLSQFAAPEGSRVGPGQVIAMSGNTGRSTGPHLHVENFYANGGITRLNSGGIPRFQSRGLVDLDTEGLPRNMAGVDVPVTAPDPSRDAQRAEVLRQMAFERALNAKPQLSNDEINAQTAQDYTNHPSELTPFERKEDRPAEIPIGEAFRNYGYQIPKVLKQWLGTKEQELPVGARPYKDNGMFSGLPPEVPASAPAATTAPITDKLVDSLKNEYGTGSKPPKPTGGGDTSGSNTSGGNTSGASDKTTGINTLTPRRSAFDEFAEQYKNDRAEFKKQKEEDKYMALISAGLGMMSGTSPNALANIGQGAMQGVAYHGQASKQRAAEKAAMDKAMMSAQRYKSMEEISLANQALRERMHGDTVGMQSRRLDLDEDIKTATLERQDTVDLARQFENSLKLNEAIEKNWDIGKRATDKDGWAAAQRKMQENQRRADEIQSVLNSRLKMNNPDALSGAPTAKPKNTMSWNSFNQ